MIVTMVVQRVDPIPLVHCSVVVVNGNIEEKTGIFIGYGPKALTT